MSRTASDLLVQLERERSELVAIHDELAQQVGRGEIQGALAGEILTRACGGIPYKEALARKDAHIAEARSIVYAQRKELAIAVSPGAVVIIVGFALLYSYGGITGLFTFSDETFYQYEVGQTVNADASIALPLTQNISSLRINGEISGTGTATIYLVSAGMKYRAAHFDAKAPEPSLLTGLFTADTEVTEPIVELNDSNITTPQSELVEEPVTSDLPFEGAVPDTSAIVDNTNESNETNETNNSVQLPDTDVVVPSEPGVIVLPNTPQEATPENALVEPRTEELDNECLDTCALPPATPQYELQIEMFGDVTVQIDSVVFGVRPENEQKPEENVTVPLPTSSTCVIDADCGTGVCVTSVYEGSFTSGVCAANKLFCTANGTAYSPGDSLGVSSCVASNARAAWLVQSGEGRFEIQDANNTTVAVIDKFGTFAVRGVASFGVNPASSGWIIQDANNTTAISVSSTGLEARGTLTERTIPAPTAGGDFIIQDKSGIVHAVLTEDGDVLLNGDLISEVELQ